MNYGNTVGNFLLYRKNEGSDKRGPDNQGSTVVIGASLVDNHLFKHRLQTCDKVSCNSKITAKLSVGPQVESHTNYRCFLEV